MKRWVTPLTVPEARAILVADEALDLTFEARQAAGQMLGIAESEAWIKLVESANQRLVGPALGTPPPPAAMLSILACREGSSWVVQAIEEDVASQGDSLLDALADLGRMFDTRDHVLATENNIAPNPRAPVEYTQAINAGHLVGVLPLGVARVAQVYIGISPFERRTS